MRKAIIIIALAAASTACNNDNYQKNTAETEATELRTATVPSTSELYGKEWKLTELNGKAVVPDTTFPQYPHLIFQEKERISGNLGCNGFGGNIKFEKGNAITITELTSTEMACPNLEVEQEFFEVLNNAKSYTVQNDVLTLSNDKKEVTAELKGFAK